MISEVKARYTIPSSRTSPDFRVDSNRSSSVARWSNTIGSSFLMTVFEKKGLIAALLLRCRSWEMDTMSDFVSTFGRG